MVHRYLQTTLLLNLPTGVTNPCYLAIVGYDTSELVFVDTLDTAACTSTVLIHTEVLYSARVHVHYNNILILYKYPISVFTYCLL